MLKETGTFQESIQEAISKDVNRAGILAGLDLKTATEAQIDARYDAALARRLDVVHSIFAPASGKDLKRIVSK